MPTNEPPLAHRAPGPLWATLIARVAQASGRSLGLLAATFDDGTSSGQAGAGFRFAAGPGRDASTGRGSPDETALLSLLQAQADAQLASGLE